MALHCSNCGKALGDDAFFCSACGRPVANPSTGAFRAYRPPLMRARAGRKVAGICQGFATYLGWDVTLLRIVVAVLAVLTFPIEVVIYLILWLVMPEEPLILPPAASINTAA